jgi:hypothetical protein
MKKNAPRIPLLILLFLAYINAYEWDEWDYYRILGLDRRDNKNADEDSIRKAYRAQAKLFHPDKLLGTNTTKEEANARFSKIAEAYQVLADEEQRRIYDDSIQQQFHKVYQRERGHEQPDPFTMFEQFFGPQVDMHDYETKYFADEPINIQERQEILVHPTLGEIVQVLQKYEYESYYRVLMQEFVEEWDPHEEMWVSHPLGIEPVVMEEGYKSSPNLLFPQEILTLHQDRTFLALPPFRAGLSRSCKLMVFRGKKKRLWVSPVKQHWQQGGQCVLSMQGPNLMLSLNGELLWRSPGIQELWKEDFMTRLDTDGSLTVYRLEEPDEIILTLLSWTRQFTPIYQMILLVGRISFRKQLACVWSSGPAGCFRPGRLLVRFARIIKHQVELAIYKLHMYYHSK